VIWPPAAIHLLDDEMQFGAQYVLSPLLSVYGVALEDTRVAEIIDCPIPIDIWRRLLDAMATLHAS